MIFITIVISVLYLMLIATFVLGLNKSKIVKNKNTAPKNRFSLVIPFRNEAHHLPDLLKSLSEINYPIDFFEILLVNDDSEDNFQPIIEEFIQQNPNINLSLFQNERQTPSPKKDAINTAIKRSNLEWIVTTDADCKVPKLWLQLFNQFIEVEQPVFISAPVKFRSQNSWLFHFQNLNFISLMGSTIGGFGIHKPIMCNGANLCYRKSVFFEVGGFEDNTNIASGDDIFLLEKMVKAHPKKVNFLNSEEAIVETKAEISFNLFVNQQIRWASKSTAYQSFFAQFVGLFVFLANVSVIILGITTWLSPEFWQYFLFIFMLKILADFVLIAQTSIFLKTTTSLKFYPIASLIYPFFIVFTGILSTFKTYQWKGRSFKK
ncbi:MAG: glycosyltransferase [Lutibacter sp.]